MAETTHGVLGSIGKLPGGSHGPVFLRQNLRATRQKQLFFKKNDFSCPFFDGISHEEVKGPQ
jgi:hypothetical protein